MSDDPYDMRANSVYKLREELAFALTERDALRAENARLADKLKSVTEHRDFLLGRNVDPTMERADRYWEARWRDEAAENARLTKERDNALHRAAEYRDKCNSLSNENRALRAARAAMGETE